MGNSCCVPTGKPATDKVFNAKKLHYAESVAFKNFNGTSSGSLRPLTASGVLHVTVGKAEIEPAASANLKSKGVFITVDYAHGRFKSVISKDVATPQFDMDAIFKTGGKVDSKPMVEIIIWDGSGKAYLGGVNLDVSRIVTGERPPFDGEVGIYVDNDTAKRIGTIYLEMTFEPL